MTKVLPLPPGPVKKLETAVDLKFVNDEQCPLIDLFVMYFPISSIHRIIECSPSFLFFLLSAAFCKSALIVESGYCAINS